MYRAIQLFCISACLVSLNAAPLTVQNAGFESAILPITFADAFASNLLTNTGTLDNWTATGTSAQYAGAFQQFVTGGYPNWTNTWWGGQNIAYFFLFSGSPAGLEQTLGDVLQSNTTYTLQVEVGRRLFDNGNNFGYDVQLLAGTTLLASGNQLSLTVDSAGTHTLTYLSGDANPNAGQNLSIRLLTTSGATEVFFDNVRLDATQVPEPGSAGLALAACAGLLWLHKKR